MTELESLAESTCRLLAARDLKAICRWRGFHPPAGNKDALASFVAPRLLEPTGVAAAMASLEELGRVALHAIAMAEEPPGLKDLATILRPGRPSWETDNRLLLRKLSDSLLNRGLVLIQEDYRIDVLRLKQLAFRLPESHRPLLPFYPVPTRPLDDGASAGRFSAFCRQVLRSAVRGRSAKAGRGRGLLGRASDALSVADGRIVWHDAALPDLPELFHQVRSEWTRAGKAAVGPRRLEDGWHVAEEFGHAWYVGKRFEEAKRVLEQIQDAKRLDDACRAAEYVLSHLPPGTGTAVKDLREALSRLGHEVAEADLKRFCDDGYRAGLLARQGRPAAFAARELSQLVAEDGALVFEADDRAVRVDPERTGVGALLELATVSRVEVEEGQLRLVPDLVRLGRKAPQLASLAALEEVRGSSRAFEEAVREVEDKRGRLLLHVGLLVLRIDDLGLRTLVCHRLGGAAHPLGGPYLAAPRGLGPEIEKLVRQEGFVPRRIS